MPRDAVAIRRHPGGPFDYGETEMSIGDSAQVQVDVPFVDLKGSGRRLGPAFSRELETLMEEGAFVNGRYVAAFEGDFASACGRAHCVGVASGLDALRLGLIAQGIEPGDEVIVPAMTFIATWEAVVQAGGTPARRRCPRRRRQSRHGRGDGSRRAPNEIRHSGPSLRPIVDLTGLNELATRHDLVILEDACQAHGAARDGRVAGGCGDAAAFSFYPSKNLGAMGDAGAFVTDDEGVAAKVRSLREHGQVRRYHSDRVGYTSRLDAIQALVLSHKLPLLEDENRARSDAASWYSEALTDVGDLQLPIVSEGSAPVWHLYPVRTGDPVALADFLARRGISTGHHYPQPPHLSEAFASLGHVRGSFPVAEAVARQTVSLPIYPGIDEMRQEAVVRAVRAFFIDG